MNWDAFILFVVMNVIPSQAYYSRQYRNEMEDRNSFMNFGGIQRVPRSLEDLPRSPKMHPGHSLLRPSRGMLKSAVMFPMTDVSKSPVYGNLENLGITYGRHGERIRYSDFRKANNILSLIMDLTEDINKKQGDKEDGAVIVIEADPLENENLQVKTGSSFDDITQISEEKNDGNEVLDLMDGDMPESNEGHDLRRAIRLKRTKYRNRLDGYEQSETEESSGSSDFEKNPGNPYTVHKNKYIQNWMWNHKLDGDHMNFNPYAPDTYPMGPSGADLFFARKWWYFNQDDYKPLR